MSDGAAARAGATVTTAEFRMMVDPRKAEYVPGSMYTAERQIGKSIKILEDRAWAAPEDAALFRKLARCRY